MYHINPRIMATVDNDKYEKTKRRFTRRRTDNV